MFAFIESHQTQKAPTITLEKFGEELMPLVDQIDGLEDLKFEDLSRDTTVDEWNNKKNDSQRKQALGRIKISLYNYMDDGGSCADQLCNRKHADYPSKARSAFECDHLNKKSDEPNLLARKTDGSFVEEALDEDKGMVTKCPFHHDRGTNRSESLLPTKFVRLLRAMKSERDEHRSPKEIMSDPIRKLKYASFILETNMKPMLRRWLHSS